ncbi:unnamed protein product [Adineta steineri]|uniref:Uncharacterized protein n=1 Tax=Adineta steineri TaxID=433720 RepID=A0A815FH88_9BILA|nr:unnamed protein product [Adineta steineri]CAF1588550.1 unnamed protein product [Adineta steineri]
MENKTNGDEQQTDIEDEENIIIICFDPDNEFNDHIEDLKQQINDSFIFYSELELCINFIKSIVDKTIFLIISPSSISQLNNFNQIKNIFLFDVSNNSNECLSFEDSKIIGIYDKFDLLLTAITKQINLIETKMSQCCFFDQIQYENKDLSKQSNSFLWHQLFPDVLLHLSSDQQFENVDQSILEQFPWINDYKPNEAVGLFMKYPSLREFINKALKNEDIKQLYMLRYFLRDLIQNLQFDNIQQQNDQLWIIKLISVNDGQIIKQKYIDDTRRQFPDLSISIIFGKLICDMSQWNQSQAYFEYSLNNYSHTEDLAWVEHGLGQAHHWKGEWNESRIYYDRSYERMMKNEPVRIKDSAVILSDIGKILYLQGQIEESFNFHEKALAIHMKYYSPYHPHIAISLYNIGLIFRIRQKEDEALVFFQQVLLIQEKYYDSFHVDIGTSLTQLPLCLTKEKRYDEALNCHQRALAIYEKYYPLGHVSVAFTLSCMSYMFYVQDKQNQFSEAVDFAQQSITFTEKSNPTNYRRIANNLSNISEALMCQNKFDEAFDFEQKALNILKIHCPTNIIKIIESLNQMGDLRRKQEKNSRHIKADIPFTLMSLGIIKYNQRDYDESLNYYYRAANILKEFYSTDYSQIIHSLNWVAFIYYKKQSYDRAIEFYERCLRIDEANSIPGQLTIDKFLMKLSSIKRAQLQYESSLAYELNCLLMREKVLPPNHQDIGESLSNIGLCYEHLNQRKSALDYYKRALVVYEQCSLATHRQWPIELKIEKLSTEMNQFNI